LLICWVFFIPLHIIYVFIIPPWQQNDEPGNFEYAWLLGNVKPNISRNFYVPSIRREISSSMIESNFYSNVNLLDINSKIAIGPEQIGSPPAYFFLLGSLLRQFRGFDVNFQLYAGRFISVFLLNVIIFIGYKTAKLLFDKKAIIIWMVMFIGAHPGVIDKLSALNDDVWATLSVSLVAWMSIYMIKKQINILSVFGMIVGISFCILSKGSAWPAIPTGLLAILLAVFRNRRIYIWLTLIFILFLSICLSLSFDKKLVANFYSFPSERILFQSAPHGRHIMKVASGTSSVQVISKDKVVDLSGKKILVGAYMWSDSEFLAEMPVVVADEIRIFGKSNPTKVSTTPILRFLLGDVPESTKKLSLNIFTNGIPPGNSLYLDCIFIISVEEEIEISSLTSYDKNCTFITINEKKFPNFIKNGSAEVGWPSIRPIIANTLYKTGYVRSETDIWSIFDLGAPYDYYYKGVVSNLFRTYWGGFGWGGVRLLGNKPYRFFLWLSLFALIGNMITLQKGLESKNWNIILLLFILFVMIFIFAMFRAASNFYIYTFMPTSRYILPAVLLISIFFSNGLHRLIGYIEQTIKGSLIIVPFIFFMGYNIWAWFSILTYFRG